MFYSNFDDRIKYTLCFIESSEKYSPHLVHLRDNYGIKKGPYLVNGISQEETINKFGLYIVDWQRYLNDRNITESSGKARK